ncbi:MAG: hypothetical protein ACE5G7_07285 [Candidatus Hydrothermarchaeaceae archaeon]
MFKGTKLKLVVIALSLFGLLSVISYYHYQQQRQEVLDGVGGIEFGFKNVVRSGLVTPDLVIRGYRDAVLLNIPLSIANPGGKAVQLEEVILEVSIARRPIEERKIMGLRIPARTDEELLLEDIEMRTEVLDEILTTMDLADPEKATLTLAIDVYVRYPYEIMNTEITRPKIKLARIEGDVFLLSIMGGKTQEEAASEFVF